MANVDTQNKEKKNFLATLFEDLSLPQVIAGALAAATVFLFSSVIGVAGSLIGAAVGSVVSAVSSQVYKKMLSASADKIRDAAPGDSPKPADPDETRVLNPVPSDKTHVIDPAQVSRGATKVMGADDVRYQAHAAAKSGEVDPAVQRAHVRRHRKARVQRNVLVVSVVSALLAIAVSAGLIHVFTAGQGIGEKTEPIFTSSQTAEQAAHEKAADAQKQSATANKNEQSSSSQKDTSSSDTSNSGSGTSGSASSGSDSTGGSTSGSGSGSNSGGSSTSGSGSSSSAGTSGSGSSSSGSDSSGSASGSGSSSSGSSSGSGSSSEGSSGSSES